MFKPSDKIVCVEDRFEPVDHTLFSELPRRGHVYVVREFRVHRECCGVLLVGIVGKRYPGSNCEYGFRAERFRKLTDGAAPRRVTVELAAA